MVRVNSNRKVNFRIESVFKSDEAETRKAKLEELFIKIIRKSEFKNL